MEKVDLSKEELLDKCICALTHSAAYCDRCQLCGEDSTEARRNLANALVKLRDTKEEC